MPLLAASCFSVGVAAAVPEIRTESGWRLKPRGRLNYDAATVDSTPVSSGNVRFRRIRLGVEGDAPGGFAYKAEADFADDTIRAVDVALSWRASDEAPIELTIGHLESLNGLEQITSSRYTSTIERGAYNEAFGNVRRTGAYATYIAPDDQGRISAGVFQDTVNERTAHYAVILGARGFWSPTWQGTRFHLGGSINYRTYERDRLGVRYRARPFTAMADDRFVDTGELALKDDLILGGEFIAIRGPWHVIVEAQRLSADTIRPGDMLRPNEIETGRRVGFSPKFSGAYAEIGYFFTGETRGYRDGLWARTKPLKPLGKGGIGAVSINLRYDTLDLRDQVRGGLVAADRIDGGRQSGAMAALVWQPLNHLRFTFQYGHGEVRGGRFATGTANGFGFDMGAFRAAWDF